MPNLLCSWRGSAGRGAAAGEMGISWVLYPFRSSWIIIVIWLFIALSMTPDIDCPRVEEIPNVGVRWTPHPLMVTIIRDTKG